MDGAELYQDREQTLVKHEILKRYLERFALIVGSRWETITYVDCFAGPWNVRSQVLADSSFAIALAQLRRARDKLAERGRRIELRCYFLENTPDAYLKLKQFSDSITDASIETRNAAFEESISHILQFVKDGGQSSFPFIFIDPTGWNGVAIRTIEPLLKLKPGEVLINFMTDFIKRFVDSPLDESQPSFTRLFGSEDAKARVRAASLDEREDVAVSEYCTGLKLAGDFRYTCAAFVLHPIKDTTYYHLIYATRDPKGVEVFKDIEKKAMEVMEKARAAADDRHEQNRTKQKALNFGEEDAPNSRHYETLRKRYLHRARSNVQELLTDRRKVPYDMVWETALALPLVWESDVKKWISEWQTSGELNIEGLKPRARVPQRSEGHVLVWSPKMSP